ncbi:hypothetical protein TRVL_09908 [Trypanosoma vivax]|nr:hypothetical protein TRVL_09908 [Trypanosoma vivax]
MRQGGAARSARAFLLAVCAALCASIVSSSNDKAVAVATAGKACALAKALGGIGRWAHDAAANDSRQARAAVTEATLAVQEAKSIKAGEGNETCAEAVRAAVVCWEAIKAEAAEAVTEADTLQEKATKVAHTASGIAGGIKAFIGLLSTYDRGQNSQNSFACIGANGAGAAAAQSETKGTLAGYQKAQLKACFADEVEATKPTDFEGKLATTLDCATLFDGTGNGQAVVAAEGGAAEICNLLSAINTGAALFLHSLRRHAASDVRRHLARQERRQ